MPVKANNNINKNYNSWRIKEYTVRNDVGEVDITYGLSYYGTEGYEYITTYKERISGEDFLEIAKSNPGKGNLKKDTKYKLYKHLIKKGLIDDNDIS